MATLRFEIKQEPTRSGKFPILLRVSINGKRASMASGVELKSVDHFIPEGKNDKWVKSTESDYKSYNEKLKELKGRASDVYDEMVKEGIDVSSKMVVDRLKPKMAGRESEKIDSFMEYARKRMNEVWAAGGVRNWKKYNGFYNKLEAFLKKEGRKDLLFTEVTPSFVARFESYLHGIHNARHPEKMLHQNSIQVILKAFRAITRAAIKEGVIGNDQNPFVTYEIKGGVTTEKGRLNWAEIGLIEALSLEEGSLIWNCRNAFLFSFYCAGIRAGDLIQLRWCNITSDGRLNYQMGKNHKVRDLVLVEQASAILKCYHKPSSKASDYIFPFMDKSKPYASAMTQEDRDTLPVELKKRLLSDVASKNALLNKYLKKIAAMAGIEKKVSMHISRHSFAKVAKEEGTDNSCLKDLLAHSSIKVTEGYMGHFDTQKTDEAMKNIFSRKGSSKKAALVAMLEGMDEDQVASILEIVKGRG